MSSVRDDGPRSTRGSHRTTARHAPRDASIDSAQLDRQTDWLHYVELRVLTNVYALAASYLTTYKQFIHHTLEYYTDDVLGITAVLLTFQLGP